MIKMNVLCCKSAYMPLGDMYACVYGPVNAFFMFDVRITTIRASHCLYAFHTCLIKQVQHVRIKQNTFFKTTNSINICSHTADAVNSASFMWTLYVICGSNVVSFHYNRASILA